MVIMGIDPHCTKPYGYAIFDGETLVKYGLSNLLDLYTLALSYNMSFISVEDQYMNKNYNTAKRLSWSAGKILGMAEFLRIRSEVVNVATWKAKMKAQKGIHIQRVKELYDLDVKDDEASAILIARYTLEYLVK